MVNQLLFIYGLIIKHTECALDKKRYTDSKKNLYELPEMMLTENSFSLASTLVVMIKDFLESIEELCLQERAERLTHHVLLHHFGTQCLADQMGFIFFC